MATASNVFRVGDYVYVETNPSQPYQIRRIEELTKTSNGQVEAKVQCFYRKRDLSSTLSVQAERHLISSEEDAEIEMGDVELDDVSRHQLTHREVFLSRQYENINANTIRGKCLVTLYNEAEVLPKYLEKEDWFNYLLVYDPQQKTLLADKGETGVGILYQAQIPKLQKGANKADDRDLSKLETLVWDPNNPLAEKQADQFLVISRSVGTFARALDYSSSTKQPSLQMSAAAASRDITLFHAMTVLHNSGYNISKAISLLVPAGGPVLCKDEMEEWSAGEANLFEEALQKYGKDFGDIQKDFLPWKSISSIVEYYYMWKTTDRYLQQKRLKAVSKESNLTQIYIPGLGSSTTTKDGKTRPSTIILTPPPGVTSNLVGVTCEGCCGNQSQQWYPWSPANSPHRFYLCTLCWIYWKKYGGLKKPDGFSGKGKTGLEPSYTCRVCGKIFNRAERLSSHMTTHKTYKCVVAGCEKFFNGKPHLTRHLTAVHGCRPPSPRKLKPRSPFYMKATMLTRMSRRLCPEILDAARAARAPGRPLNIPEIKTQCLKRITIDECRAKLKAKRQMKKRFLEAAVKTIKTLPPKPKLLIKSKPKLLPLASPTSTTMGPSSPTSPAHVTSPARKLTAPSKSYVPIQPAPPKASDWKYHAIPQVKPVMHQNTSNHMLARKRSYDVVQQNGIDGPSPKRLTATSPLGKKGCECTYCGKILHNQASLTHHEQTVHASSEPPAQRSYPAYCDVSTGTGPGSKKIVPYAQHSVTSYKNGQMVDKAAANNTQNYVRTGGTQTKTFLLPKGNMNSTPGNVKSTPGGVAPSHNKTLANATSGENIKVTTNGKVNKVPKKIAVSGTDQEGPQYIDPPEEFQFVSNKKSRKARRTLPSEQQRAIARKPWKEIEVDPNVWSVIYIGKRAKDVKETKEQVAAAAAPAEPIVIDDD